MIDAVNTNSVFDFSFLRDLEADTQARTHNQPFQGEVIEENNTKSAGENKVSPELEENQDKNKQVKRPGSKNPGELSEEEKKEVQELKETDRKIRRHEMAHLAAARGIAISGANFEYKRGPDGVNYAVGGDVQIDASKERDPEATIDKAQRIVTAALAPSDPSPQDRKVAAQARRMEAQARMDLARKQQEETSESREIPGKSPKAAESPGEQRPNPGIHAYKQNQAFAPGAAESDTNTNPNSITNNINNTTPRLIPMIPVPHSRLDMVA